MSSTLARPLQDRITIVWIDTFSAYNTSDTMISGPLLKNVTRETSLPWKEGKGKLCNPS